MTAIAAPARDRLAVWCGWVLVGAAALTPLLAWLAPLGFAPLVSLVGLLALPALRLQDGDRPALMALFAGLIWAAASNIWSPFRESDFTENTAVRLAVQIPLYFSAVCAARRAEARLRRLALSVLAWGMAALGLVLLVEAFTNAGLYLWLHDFYEPIREDWGRRNVGHATTGVALLWPLAALGAPSRLRPWLSLVVVAGVAAAALAFSADATVVALVLAPLVALAVLRWPRGAPTALAAIAAAFFILTPLIVWAAREFGQFAGLEDAAPASWGQRLGYWSHAVDWIADRPLRGLGLDASRVLGPGIQLHPHNSALQIWLELGVIGAVAAALFWGLSLARLARKGREPAAGASAGAAAAYLMFGAVSFGVWQEWWLALGAFVAVLTTMALDGLCDRPGRGRDAV